MIMRSIALCAAAVSLPLALLAAPSALAAPPASVPWSTGANELSFVVSREDVVNDATKTDLLGGGVLAPMGVRLGYGFAGPWSVVGGWQRHHRAQTLYVPLGADGDELSEVEVVQGLTVHQLTAGIKAQHALKPWLAPYATAQLSALRGSYLMDENVEVDDNPNQLRGSGMAVGGIAAVGIDLRPVRVKPVRLGTHLEFGYALHSRLSMKAGTEEARPLTAEGEDGSLGAFALRGLHVQWGVGLRF